MILKKCPYCGAGYGTYLSGDYSICPVCDNKGVKQMDNLYIRIGVYKGEQVYYSPTDNNVYLEKDNTHLATPTAEERKDLIEYGLIKVVNKIILEQDSKGLSTE